MNLVCMANKRNRRGVSLLFAFLVPFFFFLIVQFTAKEVKLWMQICMFISICALAWYLIRHQLCTFIYEVTAFDESEGEYLFIYTLQGKRKSLLLRLSLESLLVANALAHETKKSAPREKKHCNACYNLLPDTLLRLRFKDGAGCMTVDLEANEEMTAFFLNYLKERDSL